MRVLVTGATGFLGGHLVTALAQGGNDVIAVGRNPVLGSQLEGPKVTFCQADLSDPAQVGALPTPVDVLIHSAALSSAWGAYEDFYRANVTATENVLNYCQINGVPRLVHISTPSLYFRFADQYDIKEDAFPPPHFVNHYAATKYQAERVLAEQRQPDGPTIAILRPRGLFGEGDTALMPRLERIASRGWFPLPRGGKAVVDITYVGNVVQAVLLAAEGNLPSPVECYNITNGESAQMGELLRVVFDRLGMNCRFVKVPWLLLYGVARSMETVARLFHLGEPQLTAYAAGVLAFSQTLNIDKARRELGYEPEVMLSEGIDRYVRWRKEQATGQND